MRMNIALIVVGLLIASIGIVRIVTSSQEKPATKTPSIYTATKTKESETVPKIDKEAEASKTNSKQIGSDFEGFMADIFKEAKLTIKQWNQGTTSPGGAYAENELNPDFFVVQKINAKPIEYWVECKFRSSIPYNGFELEDYQMQRYRKIQGNTKRKILIALGIAGTGCDPKRLFIIPLDTLARYKHIPEKYLANYEIEKNPQAFADYLSSWFINEVFKN